MNGDGVPKSWWLYVAAIRQHRCERARWMLDARDAVAMGGMVKEEPLREWRRELLQIARWG